MSSVKIPAGAEAWSVLADNVKAPPRIAEGYEPETRHLGFEELTSALGELAELIEESQRLSAGDSRGRPG